MVTPNPVSGMPPSRSTTQPGPAHRRATREKTRAILDAVLSPGGDDTKEQRS